MALVADHIFLCLHVEGTLASNHFLSGAFLRNINSWKDETHFIFLTKK